MPWKRFTPEQIITTLRKAEVLLFKGRRVGEVCRQVMEPLPIEQAD